MRKENIMKQWPEMPKAEWEKMEVLDRNSYNNWHREIATWNTKDKRIKILATQNDITASLKILAHYFKEMPQGDDLKKIAGFPLSQKISKWHVEIATYEIIRSRSRFEYVNEYYLALYRIAKRGKEQNYTINDDQALHA